MLLLVLLAVIVLLMRKFSPQIYDFVIVHMTAVWYKDVILRLAKGRQLAFALLFLFFSSSRQSRAGCWDWDGNESVQKLASHTGARVELCGDRHRCCLCGTLQTAVAAVWAQQVLCHVQECVR